MGFRWPFGRKAAVSDGDNDYWAGPGGGALQVAVLPYRFGRDGELQIMLITSRNSGRWVIPKGWPVKGLTLPQSAAREALEEAGVEGDVGLQELGRISYRKASSGVLPTERALVVYPLQVLTKLSSWPESTQRRRRWVSRVEAARAVSIPGLMPLILNFAPDQSQAD